ncbi:cold-regulated protein 28-like isoform X2 [Andrographis paniculata]|uniref:cold-regulated protein 28-like isoform X2 n=1 Tax=Andrographis paniculata TaxID=175694 RepID=UPI0021E6F945|nr:cold-regulated protein 28-like isoform X2 [Andrographis paniculata]
MSPPRRQRPPAAPACSDELTLSNSDSSVLTVLNCQDISHRSAIELPGDCTAWTDEKHSLYIHQLEMSFIKQLNHSKYLLQHFSYMSWRDLNIAEQHINTSHSSEQFQIARNVNSQKRGRVCKYQHNGKQFAPLSGQKLGDSVKLGIRRRYSHGLASLTQKCSSRKPAHQDLFHLTREGMGQNFSDEDNSQSEPDSDPSTKRLKPALALVDTSSQNQLSVISDHALQKMSQQKNIQSSTAQSRVIDASKIYLE